MALSHRIFVTFLLFLSFFFLKDLHPNINSINLNEEVPDWVNPCLIELQDIPAKFLEINVQYLLWDTQKNWEEKTSYFHYAAKALTSEGVREVAQLQIHFNPDYQKLVVHSICVHREGKKSERKDLARCHLLQREPRLEQNLFLGTQTLVLFLDDIRAQDVVEYSYSIIGENPIVSSCFSDLFLLQDTVFVHQIYHRLLINAETILDYKTFHSTIEPKIQSYNNRLEEWIWKIEEPNICFFEANQPSWHMPISSVQLSQYRDWSEVAKTFTPYYVLPKDLKENPGDEIKQLVDDWSNRGRNEEERALFALRYVQDEVRYFGFEQGSYAFVPSDPRTIFHRRYGDCKDKTFLLMALLDLMQIRSTPVLVNLSRGEIVTDFLPTPFIFDHIVLRIDLPHQSYWVDPTWTHQGGSLEMNAFPDYGWGLPLCEDSTGLVKIPVHPMEFPIKIDTKIKLNTEDEAEIQVTREFHGAKADVMRNYLGWLGHIYLSAYFFDDIEKIYGKSRLLNRSFEDHREENTLVFIDSYQVSTLELREGKCFKIKPFVTNAYLPKGFNPDRISPLALTFPLWVKEKISVETSLKNWSIKTDTASRRHETFFYDRSLKRQGNSSEMLFEIRFLRDHVPVSSLQEFWGLIQEIDRDALFKIKLTNVKNKTLPFFETLN